MVILFCVPQKKSFEINLSLPLRTFIRDTYGDKDDYAFAVEALNQLRNNALFRCAKNEKLPLLLKYYDQLHAVQNKLPISENQIRISFKWQDALDKGSLLGGKRTLTLSKGTYEKSCVLFNIGACASEIAVSQQLETDEGLKNAAKHFQLAAGAFLFLKENVMSLIGCDPTPDLFPQTTAFLSSLMLAQAQEILLMKAEKAQMNNGVIAKIASQCGFLYSETYKYSQTEHNKDMMPKSWLAVINAKQYLFQAEAEYREALSCNESRTYNIGLCRLTKAWELIQSAVTKAGQHMDLKEINDKIRRAYESAKKDNDYIYHERVPAYKTLDPIAKAALVKPTDIKFPISENFRDLFSSLIPLEVNNALLSFTSKRIDFSNQEINRLREATNLLNAFMASLNLPAEIEDVSETSSIPQSLVTKSSEVKREGGIQCIDRMMTELPKLLTRNKEILDETVKMLDDEEKSDQELKIQFKEKWTRTPSKELTAPLRDEARKYREVTEIAINADRIVQEKYRKNRNYIAMLSKPQHELEKELPPASSTEALKSHYVVKELRRLCEEVETIKAERQVIESELKSQSGDSAQTDFIATFQSRPGVDQNLVIAEKIEEVYQPLRQQVNESLSRQEKLVANIQRAHIEFAKQKQSNSTSKLRSELLTNLAIAYDAFKELLHNLNEGTKFYNDLTPLLLKFQSKISDFCFARKTEKDELFKDIQQGIVSSIESTNRCQVPPRPPPPEPSQANFSAPPIPAVPTSQVPPYPINNCNPFAAPPPLPAGYNPYVYYGSNMPYPTEGYNSPYPK